MQKKKSEISTLLNSSRTVRRGEQLFRAVAKIWFKNYAIISIEQSCWNEWSHILALRLTSLATPILLSNVSWEKPCSFSQTSSEPAWATPNISMGSFSSTHYRNSLFCSYNNFHKTLGKFIKFKSSPTKLVKNVQCLQNCDKWGNIILKTWVILDPCLCILMKLAKAVANYVPSAHLL